MKKILILIIALLITTYFLSGSYNQSIAEYELSRFISSDMTETDLVPGKHFQEIGNKVTYFKSDIVVLFTYDSKSSLLLNYELSKNKKLYEKIAFSHATYDRDWHNDARLFFTLKEYSLEKKTLSDILRIYHADNGSNKVKLNNLLTELQISHVPFWSTYSSLNTKPIFEKHTEIEINTNTEGFPLIIIKGQYLIKPWLYKSLKDISMTINYLINK